MAQNTNEVVAVAYMTRRWPAITWAAKSRFELHAEFWARLPRNIDHGKWAVAIVGSAQWMRESGIGDGITSASAALVTRCATREEAEAIAAAANDLEPGLLPGQGFAWRYAATQYEIADYLSQQAQRNGRRECDRRIAG